MTLTTQQVEGNGMNVFGEQNGFTAMTSDELLHINGGSQVIIGYIIQTSNGYGPY
ncbi:MAG TPA: hypothetical protein PLU33_09035 [Treponemataceae bacterium]|nr:hypothetical protein [Treponemataceae bacterium]HQL05274.1 hypothetical protein [Treponemataceae bacterium]